VTAVWRSLDALLVELPPLYVATLAVIIGDALGNCHLFVPLFVAAFLSATAVIAFMIRRAGWGVALAALALIAAATVPVRALLVPDISAQTITRLPDGARIILQGSVVRAPERAEGGRIYLFVNAERAGSSPATITPAAGLVRVTAVAPQPVRVGDRISVAGRIRFPRTDGDEGEFDYRSWLMRQRIAATMFAASSPRALSQPIAVIAHREVFPASQIERIRDRIGQFIEATIAPPQSAELKALIIGDRSGIGEDLRQSFALTGMAHLLVISGLHLGFVAGAAFLLVRLIVAFFPRLMALGYASKLGAVAAAVAVLGYASIAGGHVSTTRALVMVLAYAFAILINRSRELLASLALAALIICFTMPGSTADIGFQLSFASVLVILLGMRRFNAWWRWHYANPLAEREPSRFAPAVHWLAGYIAVSFWAMVGTAPLTAFHFDQFSIVGLVANAVVVPVMGFGAVIAGLIGATSAFFCAPFAAGCLIVAAKLAAIGTALARWFANWPFAWNRIFTPTPVELAVAYGFILLWLTAPLPGAQILRAMRGRRIGVNLGQQQEHEHHGEPGRLRAGVAVMLAVVLAIDAGWWTYDRYFNPDLRVTFLAVGEGDAAVVRFPGGPVMLIDGGGAFRGSFDPGERIVAPYLWAHKIMRVDYVAVSHPDRDHFGGLTYIVRNFAPAQFWTGGAISSDASYEDLLNAVTASGARQWLCDSASPPIVVRNAAVQCLGPIHGVAELKQNNSSMVLRIVYGRETFLFVGDLEAKGERQLIASHADLHATVLKVPHHGSRTSSTPALIEAVHPRLAVISLGYLNQFHFPAPEVIARYKADGITVLRTDEDGEIDVDAAEGVMRVSTYRHRDLPIN
jgi:competence protein ComEC